MKIKNDSLLLILATSALMLLIFAPFLGDLTVRLFWFLFAITVFPVILIAWILGSIYKKYIKKTEDNAGQKVNTKKPHSILACSLFFGVIALAFYFILWFIAGLIT